jgi:hypothetical protein
MPTPGPARMNVMAVAQGAGRADQHLRQRWACAGHRPRGVLDRSYRVSAWSLTRLSPIALFR